jgi:hypothetical protein
MSFLKKLFGKPKPKKKSGDVFIENIAKKIYDEKQNTGSLSMKTLSDVSKDVVNNMFSGGLEFSKDENWLPPLVQISSSSEKALSKNKEYSVHWQDGYTAEDKWMNGIIVLRQNGKDLWQKTIDRPFDCKVANNGTVICNDSTISSLEYTKDISCKLWVLDAIGNVLFEKILTANIGDNFLISTDGTIAVFDTLNSKTEDANSIFVYILASGQLVEQFENAEGEVSKIKIDELSRTVRLNLEDNDEYEIKY